MRHLVVCFSFFSFLAPFAAHGEGSLTGLRFGLQGGVSLSHLSAPGDIESSDLTGFAGGVLLEIPLSAGLFIQPEAIFAQRGSSLSAGGVTGIESRYNSIEVPIFLKASLGNGSVRPVLFAGPNFSFNLSHSLSGPDGIGSVTFEPKKVDFGVAMGGGVDIGPAFVNLRYILGVTDVSESGASWQSRGFMAMVGVKL